ncbi:MAG: hypothetical protein LBF40_08245 [Deltaproteobacteria bacterium]|jgi:hypothetical protein|nr:hypothetical protein [Deltaproteobacteria bacterium]
MASLRKPLRASALVLVFFLACALGLPAGAIRAEDDTSPKGKVVSTYQLGNVLVTYFAPDGLQNLWGLDPAADDFFRTLNAKFKLVVLGAYGNPEEFLEFVRKVKAGEPTPVPRIALFTTTRRMPEKSYVGKSAKKQFDKYVNWFGLATNTGIIAFGFEVKANGIIEDKLGVDLDFSYKLGKFTKVYEKGEGYISVGLLSRVLLNGSHFDNYLNTTALQISDKLVFLTFIGQGWEEGTVARQNRDMIFWREALINANPAPLLKDNPEGVASGGDPGKTDPSQG